MNTRRILLVIAVLLLVFIMLGTGAIGALLWFSSQSQVGQGQLLVLDDAHLALLPSGGEPRILSQETTSEGFLYPAPSPDGTRVAYTTSGVNGTHLYVVSLADGQQKELFSVPQPMQLVYMNWSPDGRYISFMMPSGMAGLGIFIVPADGSADAQLVSGAQSGAYFAWTPDSGSLLLHLDGSVFQEGQMATFALGSEQPSVVSKNPGFFQAPAWSADGSQLFYVAQPEVAKAEPTFDDVESVLTRAAPDGSGATDLAREKSAFLFFSRAPKSDQIAYTSLLPLEQRFGPLVMVDGRTGERRIVSRENEGVVAFFWSPDGERIAYLTRTEADDPQSEHTWHVVNASGGEVRDLERFRPTVSFAGFVSFFDAYAHAFTIWSADSRLLTYASSGGVYTLDTTSGATERVADGELGMWVRPVAR